MTGIANGRRAKLPLPRPPAEVWEQPQMRVALGCQDIGAVYTLLQAAGYSQQAIAHWTGQEQPEVWAILHGRRVISYQVLSRIADGLGIPRGYLGLSCCTDSNHRHDPAGVDPATAEVDPSALLRPEVAQ